MRGHGGDGAINARFGLGLVFVTGGIWIWFCTELAKSLFG